MKKIKELIKRYQSIINYLFFGVCTTIVNVLTYMFCADFIHIGTILSTIIAWVLAVAFAYITNRKWVFYSDAKGRKEILREVISFTGCRLFTGFLDVGIMYIFVDLLGMPGVIIKFVANIIVIILNYIASKLIIFLPKKKREKFWKKARELLKIREIPSKE